MAETSTPEFEAQRVQARRIMEQRREVLREPAHEAAASPCGGGLGQAMLDAQLHGQRLKVCSSSGSAVCTVAHTTSKLMSK